MRLSGKSKEGEAILRQGLRRRRRFLRQRRFHLFADFQRDLLGLTLPVNFQCYRVSHGAGSDVIHQIAAAGDPGVIGLGDDIVDLQAGGFGGRAFRNLSHSRAGHSSESLR